MKQIAAKDLVGIAEIANHKQVTNSAVCNWRSRFPTFPKPVVELAAGPVFLWSEIELWFEVRNGKA